MTSLSPNLACIGYQNNPAALEMRIPALERTNYMQYRSGFLPLAQHVGGDISLEVLWRDRRSDRLQKFADISASRTSIKTVEPISDQTL